MDMLFLSPTAQLVPAQSPSTLACGGSFFWESETPTLEALLGSYGQADTMLPLLSSGSSCLLACTPLSDDTSLLSTLLALECESGMQPAPQLTQLAPPPLHHQPLQQTQEPAANIIEWPAFLFAAQPLSRSAASFSVPTSASASNGRCPFDRIPGESSNTSSIQAESVARSLNVPSSSARTAMDAIDFDLLDDNFCGSDTSSVSDGSLDGSHSSAADLCSSPSSSFPSAAATKKTGSASASHSSGHKVHGGAARRSSTGSSSTQHPKRKRCPIMARKSRLERKRRHQMIVEHSVVLADSNKRLGAELEGLADEIASLRAKVLQRLARGTLALPAKISVA